MKFKFIWRPGNPGTNHVAIEMRAAEEWGDEFKLRGYLTLTREEFKHLSAKFKGDPSVRIEQGFKPTGKQPSAATLEAKLAMTRPRATRERKY